MRVGNGIVGAGTKCRRGPSKLPMRYQPPAAAPALLALLLLAGMAWTSHPAGAQQEKPSRLRPEVRASRLVREADKLTRLRRHASAAPMYSQAAVLRKNDFGSWERAGWSYVDAGDPTKALQRFEKAVELTPGVGHGKGGKLICWYLLRRSTSLLPALKQHASASKIAQVRPVVLAGLRARSRTRAWDLGLGTVYGLIGGGGQRAVRPLQRVVKADPRNADAWLLLIELHATLNQDAFEKDATRRYLRLQPRSEDAFRLRALALLAKGKRDEAVAEYRRGAKAHPASAALVLAVARYEERDGNGDAARKRHTDLVAVLEKKGDPAGAARVRAQLARLQIRQGQLSPALDYYRQATKRPAASASVWAERGALAALSGKFAEAAQSIAKALEREIAVRGEKHPLSVAAVRGARMRAGLAWLAGGNRKKAASAFAGVVASLDGERDGGGAMAGAFLSWMGDGGEASPLAYQRSDERWAYFQWRQQPATTEPTPSRGERALLREIVRRHTDCFAARYALARLDARTGHPGDAIKNLEQVAKSKADWWAPQFSLGAYYYRAGKLKESAIRLRAAVKLAPKCHAAQVYLERVKSRARSKQR